MSVHIQDRHVRMAQKLVERTRANAGLAPVDMDRFWSDQEKAAKHPFAPDCPQVALGIGMSSECVWEELGEEEDWHRLVHDHGFRVALEKRYNDKAAPIVGKRLLGEWRPDPRHAWTGIRELYDIFEGKNVWHDWSYWLQQVAHTPDELKALLDRVERRLEDLREFLLPLDWAEQKARVLAAGGKTPLYRGQRGPVTFAMSLYGVENLIYLICDEPVLAERFRDLILRAMLERGRILDEEAGYTAATAPKGFYFCDDNCAMLNEEMYELFGFPILKGVFDYWSPGQEDMRGQHSDSDMGHLLPCFGKLGLTTCNFGPNLTVAQIRKNLPKAVICGQLAPFTFSRNEEVNIVAEFIRDAEMAREKRGLLFTTAGSINNGSRLTGMRLIMAAIQEFGQYA